MEQITYKLKDNYLFIFTRNGGCLHIEGITVDAHYRSGYVNDCDDISADFKISLVTSEKIIIETKAHVYILLRDIISKKSLIDSNYNKEKLSESRFSKNDECDKNTEYVFKRFLTAPLNTIGGITYKFSRIIDIAEFRFTGIITGAGMRTINVNDKLPQVIKIEYSIDDKTYKSIDVKNNKFDKITAKYLRMWTCEGICPCFDEVIFYSYVVDW